MKCVVMICNTKVILTDTGVVYYGIWTLPTSETKGTALLRDDADDV